MGLFDVGGYDRPTTLYDTEGGDLIQYFNPDFTNRRPRNLTMSGIGRGSELYLYWDAPSLAVTGYRIYQAQTKDAILHPVACTPDTSATISGLTSDTEYFFAVTSIY